MFFPVTAFAAGEETFTIQDDLRRTIDLDYTTALYDQTIGVLTLSPRLSAHSISQTQFSATECDPLSLSRTHAPRLVSSRCAVTSSGTLLIGLLLDSEARKYRGKLYRIAFDTATELPTEGKLDGDFTSLLFGAKPNGDILALKRAGRGFEGWETQDGVWRSFPTTHLDGGVFYTNAPFGWSGKRWFGLRGNSLMLLQGGAAIPVAVPPPFTGFPANITTALTEAGLLVSAGSRTAPSFWLIRDEGVFVSQIAESKTIQTREPIVWARLDRIDADLPASSLLTFSLSNDGGKTWRSFNPGQEITFHIEENQESRKLRWRVFLITNDESHIPLLRLISFRYTTQNPFPQARASRDRTRIADLDRAHRLLQEYRKKTNRAPVVSETLEASDQWKQLKDVLTSSIHNERLDIRLTLPEQKNDEYHYSGNGADYVLWVRLEDTSNRSLEQDHDGLLFNTACDDPIFCLSSIPLPQKPKPEQLAPTSARRQTKTTPHLIKTAADSRIWLITSTGFKRHILSFDRFRFYTQQLGRVRAVSQTYLDSIPVNDLVRVSDDPRVYYLWNNTRRWITSPAVFEHYGFKWEDIIAVTKEELEEFRELAPVVQ